MKRLLRVLLFTIACAGPAAGQRPEYFKVAGAMAELPFSEAVRVGNMLYVSGTIGAVPGSLQLAPGGIQPETRQALENIRTVLERHGSSLDNVVRCLVMLADMSEWQRMNEVYVTFFPKHKPARSALAASGLAMNARVESECTAVIGKGGERP